MTLVLRGACALLTLVVCAACSSDGSSTNTVPHPTIIEVDPGAFRGAPVCGDGPDDLHRYVATLSEVAAPGQPSPAPSATTTTSPPPPSPSDPLTLPSSVYNGQSGAEPVPCLKSSEFGWVVPGRYYLARIEAYDRDDLTLLQPGLPMVLDATTRNAVSPRWTTSCGVWKDQTKASSGAVSDLVGVRAEEELTRTLIDCAPWAEASR